MTEVANKGWIEDVELPDVTVKWSFSNFAGQADAFNAAGDHNFTVILPEETALKLREEGWAIKEYEGREEGEPTEYTLKIKIGLQNEPPKMYLIKVDPFDDTKKRKIRIENGRDLADIQRSTTERIDVIFTPYRWVKGDRTGITAYVKELYAVVKVSRIGSMYEDYEEV